MINRLKIRGRVITRANNLAKFVLIKNYPISRLLSKSRKYNTNSLRKCRYKKANEIFTSMKFLYVYKNVMYPRKDTFCVFTLLVLGQHFSLSLLFEKEKIPFPRFAVNYTVELFFPLQKVKEK